jgi:hypothetical protein
VAGNGSAADRKDKKDPQGRQGFGGPSVWAQFAGKPVVVLSGTVMNSTTWLRSRDMMGPQLVAGLVRVVGILDEVEYLGPPDGLRVGVTGVNRSLGGAWRRQIFAQRYAHRHGIEKCGSPNACSDR